MSESSNEAVEVAGGFADLGLETPGSYELPQKGLPVGTHKGFVKSARFVANKTTAGKKNLELIYEVREPGNSSTGKTVKETKPCNATDEAKVKGYLVERMQQLGVPASELGNFDVKALIGKPVYITIIAPRQGEEWTRVGRINLDDDGEFVSVPNPPVSGAVSQAVSAESLDY